MSAKTDRSVYLLRVQTQTNAPPAHPGESLTETKGRADLGRGRDRLGDAQTGGRAPVHAEGGWAFFVCLGISGRLKKMTE